jgi:restriction system protein
MLLLGLLKSPWAKGHIGELLVRLFAHWQLDKQTYRRLHNATLNPRHPPRGCAKP